MTQKIIFIGTRTFGDIFKSASVYLYWGIKFPQQDINQSETRTGDKNFKFNNFKLCSIVTDSNKCLSVFPPKKQIFYYLPDLHHN